MFNNTAVINHKAILGSTAGLQAWDHPAHMTTAAIAFNETERANPELIEKLELLNMRHPDAIVLRAHFAVLEKMKTWILPKVASQ